MVTHAVCQPIADARENEVRHQQQRRSRCAANMHSVRSPPLTLLLVPAGQGLGEHKVGEQRRGAVAAVPLCQAVQEIVPAGARLQGTDGGRSLGCRGCRATCPDLAAGQPVPTNAGLPQCHATPAAAAAAAAAAAPEPARTQREVVYCVQRSQGVVRVQRQQHLAHLQRCAVQAAPAEPLHVPGEAGGAAKRCTHQRLAAARSSTGDEAKHAGGRDVPAAQAGGRAGGGTRGPAACGAPGLGMASAAFAEEGGQAGSQTAQRGRQHASMAPLRRGR